MSKETQRLIGVGAAVVAVVALLGDNVLDLAVDERPDFARFFGFSLLCVGAAASIFLLLLPWAEGAPDAADRLSREGFALGLLAVVSIIVYFTGLPLVLGAGAFVLGALGEERAGRELERSAGDAGEGEAQTPAARVIETLGARRASLGWAAALTGALAFLAGLVLFVLVLVG